MELLLQQIVDPPIRKLGVLQIDKFYPKNNREKLMLKLNGLLASPGFKAWATGLPIDIDQMLRNDDGSAKASVVTLSHLEESERHFAITLILSKLISWMKTQQGTGELRALVYLSLIHI